MTEQTYKPLINSLLGQLKSKYVDEFTTKDLDILDNVVRRYFAIGGVDMVTLVTKPCDQWITWQDLLDLSWDYALTRCDGFVLHDRIKKITKSKKYFLPVKKLKKSHKS